MEKTSFKEITYVWRRWLDQNLFWKFLAACASQHPQKNVISYNIAEGDPAAPGNILYLTVRLKK